MKGLLGRTLIYPVYNLPVHEIESFVPVKTLTFFYIINETYCPCLILTEPVRPYVTIQTLTCVNLCNCMNVRLFNRTMVYRRIHVCTYTHTCINTHTRTKMWDCLYVLEISLDFYLENRENYLVETSQGCGVKGYTVKTLSVYMDVSTVFCLVV